MARTKHFPTRLDLRALLQREATRYANNKSDQYVLVEWTIICAPRALAVYPSEAVPDVLFRLMHRISEPLNRHSRSAS